MDSDREEFTFLMNYSDIGKNLKNISYRVTQQCCPGGNGPETPGDPPRGVSGGSPDILAKSLAYTDKILNFSFLFFFFENFVCICQ